MNVAGWTVDDFVAVVRGLDEADGFLGYELDASCPNVERGTEFATEERLLAELVASVRRATQRPVVVKLSPTVPDIAHFAALCESEGADGVSTINTFPGLVIDVEERRPVIGNVTGGISGPAILPMGVYATWRAALRRSGGGVRVGRRARGVRRAPPRPPNRRPRRRPGGLSACRPRRSSSPSTSRTSGRR